ncbi:MAG: hypothetical protein ACREFK_04475 [Stellaceae bacterium]
MMIDIFATQILPAVAQVRAQCLTGFSAMKGQRYNGGLMVVGRSVNGATHHIMSDELEDQIRCRAFVQLIFDAVDYNITGECPMLWVTRH